MKFVTFRSARGGRLSTLAGDGVVDHGAAAEHAGLPDFPATMQALIEGGELALATAPQLAQDRLAASQLPMPRLMAPLPAPVRSRDYWLFREHMEVSLDCIAQVLAPARDSQVPFHVGQPGAQRGERLRQQLRAPHSHAGRIR